MLRARFQKEKTGIWTQRITNEIDTSFRLTSVSNFDGSSFVQTSAECRDAVDIERGPLTSVVQVQNTNKQLVFLSINHLVSDLVSFRVVCQDLEDILSHKQPPPVYSLNFQRWASIQEQAAASLDPSKALTYNFEPDRFNYWDLSPTEIGTSSYHHRKFALDPSTSAALLGWVNDVHRSQPMELMIAALMDAYGSIFSDRPLPAVFSEGHGREPLDATVDVSQTVGWFTTMYPIQLQREQGINLHEMIAHATERIRNIPRKGWEYFAARYLNAAGRDYFGYQGMEINFNYLGVFQQLEKEAGLFKRVPVPPGNDPESAKKVKGLAIFEVTAVVRESRLEFEFLVDDRVRDVEGVDRWIEGARENLLKMVRDAEAERDGR